MPTTRRICMCRDASPTNTDRGPCGQAGCRAHAIATGAVSASCRRKRGITHRLAQQAGQSHVHLRRRVPPHRRLASLLQRPGLGVDELLTELLRHRNTVDVAARAALEQPGDELELHCHMVRQVVETFVRRRAGCLVA